MVVYVLAFVWYVGSEESAIIAKSFFIAPDGNPSVVDVTGPPQPQRIFSQPLDERERCDVNQADVREARALISSPRVPRHGRDRRASLSTTTRSKVSIFLARWSGACDGDGDARGDATSAP
jgi:hypothetical protein